MLVAYREERNVWQIVTDASALLEIRGDEERVLAAASYVSDRGLTPFDALHAVVADGEPIASSDQSYDGVTERIALEEQ